MADYITLPQFKSRFGVQDSVSDAQIAEHIAAATARVWDLTHRDFSTHVGSATARYFKPTSCDLVLIDDAYEITAVAVDDADAGTYTTAWTSTYYETEPANGIGPNAQAGWPTTAIRAVSTLTFPMSNRRRPVKVTAKWGWAAVPDAVIEATYLLAHRFYYEVSVPSGTVAPNPEFGLPGAPLVRPYTAENLLRAYARADKVIGVAG